MYKVNTFMPLQTNSFRLIFNNTVVTGYNDLQIIFLKYNNFISCKLKDANQWNMFVMIINMLNNENTVTFLIYTKSSYDDWWKLDGGGIPTIPVYSRWQVRSVKTKKGLGSILITTSTSFQLPKSVSTNLRIQIQL